MLKYFKKNKGLALSLPKGFTLIELLVVIAIIAVLASIVLVSLNTARIKGRDARRVADIKSIQVALEMYYDSQLGYPDALSSLAPTYIPAIPNDPLDATIAYAYARRTDTGSANKREKYHLGAKLEDATNGALKSDADAVSISAGAQTNEVQLAGTWTGAFDGASKAGNKICNTTNETAVTGATNDDLCYDVTL